MDVPKPPEATRHDYQDLYPELWAERPDRWSIKAKTVFLTFDDGPTIYTEQVLDTLAEKGVKATFFVVGSSIAKMGDEGPSLLNRMVSDGHTLAIHCNVHDYKQVYASVEAFLADFNEIYSRIYEITGRRADIYRYPGGSVNNFNAKVRPELLAEMERRGFTYYDWNASSGDSDAKVTEEGAYANSVALAGKSKRIILLMHDTKKASVSALPRVIDKYKEMGYRFSALSNVDKPITQ
jgi:peptidoglycan/xylan/chitin deacetylase (PgdA/CDA1 family)